MTPMTRSRELRGFTLVETLAVLVILGLLASVLVVRFSGGVGKGKQELAKTGIGLVVQKVELYQLEHGKWPPLEVGLAALSDGQAKPTDPWYLGADQLEDPWRRPYVFVAPGPDGHPYEVVSYGRDGQPGGEGEDADVTSVRLRGTAPDGGH
ncbi:MAG: type II secretion system major pseudopilin GspG [Planctomycetota bacterium JB042]